jgi:hypothetical protein
MDLAREAELTEHSVFFKAIFFKLTHYWFIGKKLDSTRGASSLSTTAVTHINAIVFKCFHELGARFNFVGPEALCGYFVLCHKLVVGYRKRLGRLRIIVALIVSD